MPQNNENLSSLRRSASDCGNPYSSKNRLLRHFIPRNDKKNQAGNVFVLIMLGVFLFGALMYSFTRSANQGTGNLTKQQSKIAAQEILNYARLVEGAVDRVRRNGCSESEISFNADWDNNDVIDASLEDQHNTKSPTDKSCHLFAENGGKLSFIRQFSFLEDSDIKKSQRLYGNRAIFGIGDDNKAELLYAIRLHPTEENLQICNAFNKLLNLPQNVEDVLHLQFMSYFSWDGNFNNETVSPAERIADDAGIALKGKSTGCLNGTAYDSGGYIFYHTLIGR